MKLRSLQVLLALLVFFTGLILSTKRQESPTEKAETEDHAADMFDWWYSQRALPYQYIPTGAYQRALETHKRLIKNSRSVTSTSATDQWYSIGPNNIGGRILALAIDPVNRSVIWAGAASGGLWKSTTGGEGPTGWSWVNTGSSVLSVSAIAIDQSNPALMYIGTGEISYYRSGLIGTPGARSSYGAGILRSTDSGATWSQTDLAWTFPQVTAVEKIIINPRNDQTLYAATSEGVYKSTDAGAHWFSTGLNPMAMDIIMIPNDTNTLFASFGNLNSSLTPGLFKSTDAGTSWTLLTNGLPSTNFGRTALAVSPATPTTIYASVSNGDPNNASLFGLYRTLDDGASWQLVNNTNYVSSQGWYDNVVAANPAFADSIYCAGLDVYNSVDGGGTLNLISDWSAGYLGVIPPGGSEGSPAYVHADQHAIVFDPFFRKTLYVATDGGVFKSTDGGSTFYGVNGGLVTTQFYNGFSVIPTDSNLALGGLQDNGVIKYQGSPSWRKVDGGDGGWNAIDPTNPSILYWEYVYLVISKSVNGGLTAQSISNGLPSGTGESNFIAPFVISHSSPNVLYAGARNIFKTTNGGLSWNPTNAGNNLNGTKISTIGVSWTSSDTLMAGTGSSASTSPVFQLFSSTNGGNSWTRVSDSLPSRYPTDITFDPTNSATVYVTFSGYGTPHLYRTTNLGHSWTNITTGVDIPHQSVVVDPGEPANIYAGTDLGVYHSSDAGTTWEPLPDGMNPSMVLDLAISTPNNKIRAVTFGSGVYERNLIHIPKLALVQPAGGEIFRTGQIVQLSWTQKYLALVNLDFSPDGGLTWQPIADSIPASAQSYSWIVADTVTNLGKIRVRDTFTGSPVASNDSSFIIYRNTDVTIGWNLLSLKVVPADLSTLSNFPGASSSAFVYRSGYNPTDTISPGIGFWLKYNAPTLFTYTGDSILTDTIPVTKGWNIIGALSRTISVSAVHSLPDSILNLPFFGYFGAYFIPDSLFPGYGYWIYAKSDGQIILSSSPSQQKNVFTSARQSISSLTFSDQAAHRQTLYLAPTGTGPSNPIFPPLPPERSFDVRFGSQKYLEHLSRASRPNIFPVTLTGVTYPLTIRWSAGSGFRGTIQVILPNGSICSLTNGEVTIPSGSDRLSIEYLPVGGNDIPASVSLAQNFPNPFNPSTTIRYILPEESRVRMMVYNIAGQVVATLADDYESAGSHELRWDASGEASGIYLYRLFVGKGDGGSLQSAGTGKMILLR